MLTIERNHHSVIVYNREEHRGIAFPNGEETDLKLYVEEIKERAQFIMPGTVLVTLLFDPKYEENNRPMRVFLETHDVESVLQNDCTAIELYEFYFAHAIPMISLSGIDYIFCE